MISFDLIIYKCIMLFFLKLTLFLCIREWHRCLTVCAHRYLLRAALFGAPGWAARAIRRTGEDNSLQLGSGWWHWHHCLHGRGNRRGTLWHWLHSPELAEELRGGGGGRWFSETFVWSLLPSTVWRGQGDIKLWEQSSAHTRPWSAHCKNWLTHYMAICNMQPHISETLPGTQCQMHLLIYHHLCL